MEKYINITFSLGHVPVVVLIKPNKLLLQIVKQNRELYYNPIGPICQNLEMFFFNSVIQETHGHIHSIESQYLAFVSWILNVYFAILLQ